MKKSSVHLLWLCEHFTQGGPALPNGEQVLVYHLPRVVEGAHHQMEQGAAQGSYIIESARA